MATYFSDRQANTVFFWISGELDYVFFPLLGFYKLVKLQIHACFISEEI